MTREIEWDEFELEKMIAVDIHDALVHSGGCGFHESLATDRNNLFLPVASVCPLCAAMDVAGRVRAAEESKAREKTGDNPRNPLPSDGRRIRTRLLSPLEAELRREMASPAAQTS